MNAQQRILNKWMEVSELDHWGVLGLQPGAAAADVKKAYFALAREFHADAFSGQDLGTAAPVLDQLFSKIAEAYDVLSDPKKRAEFDAEIAIKASGMSTDVGALLDAEQDFSKGRLLMERGELLAASKFFGKAIEANPGNNEWKAHDLFTSWWGARDKNEAATRAASLERMAKDDERLIDAVYFAGRLYLEADQLDKASRLFRKVLREKPGHELAIRDNRNLVRKQQEAEKKSGGFFAKLFGKK
jgi:curved DNA-binding protein CbpA